MAKVFIAYSHKDEELRNELDIHLGALKRERMIETWHDRRIRPGDEWDPAIAAQLQAADIVLPLISAYFIDSDYCYGTELAQSLERHERGEARVIPIILRPCAWKSLPIGKLQALPKEGKPVTKFADPHEAFAEVAEGIRSVISSASVQASAKREAQREATRGATASGRAATVPAPPARRSSNLRVKTRFTAEERDSFVAEAFEFVARYFENSLEELKSRSPKVKTRSERVDSRRFIASIYVDGSRAAEATLWRGAERGGFGMGDITYSNGVQLTGSSANDWLSVKDDGYTQYFEPSGFGSYTQSEKEQLSVEGAAEYFWEKLIEQMQ